MARDAMTPRERWLAVLRHERPDRVPMDYWATEEATRALLEHLRCADVWAMYERLHIDHVIDVAPRYAGPPLAPDTDMYGCRYAPVRYATGSYLECVSHPMAAYNSVAEIEAHYVWPSPDWFDYSTIPEQVRGRERFAVRGGGSEPFLTYKNLRGMRQAYVDLIRNPDLAHYILDRLFDFCRENTLRIHEQIPGRVDLSFVAEDLGGQESLLISRELIGTFLLPRMRRMMELVHQGGAHVFFHSDGAVREIIPDMIAAGIDLLNPIQWRCRGMDRAALKREFGARVTLHGGVDNQQTLAFGSVADVRAEVLENLATLGAGGGYILAPCHNIQAVSPPENIVAMYETGYVHGGR